MNKLDIIPAGKKRTKVQGFFFLIYRDRINTPTKNFVDLRARLNSASLRRCFHILIKKHVSFSCSRISKLMCLNHVRKNPPKSCLWLKIHAILNELRFSFDLGSVAKWSHEPTFFVKNPSSRLIFVKPAGRPIFIDLYCNHQSVDVVFRYMIFTWQMKIRVQILRFPVFKGNRFE